jgi:hypothetical protein
MTPPIRNGASRAGLIDWAQLPYRPALHDQAKGGDQCRALSRRQEVQPNRCGHDGKRKACKAGNKCRGNGAQDKQD